MLEHACYLLIGIIAGIFSGLLGVGGGIIVVPLLHHLFLGQFPASIVTHMAVGTSLAIMIFTAISSASAYQRRGLIIWPLFYKLVPGLLLGAMIGTAITRQFSSNALLMAFAVFMMIIGISLLAPKQTIVARTSLPHPLILNLVAVFIGICSGFFGVGGGSLLVPFFVFCGIEMHNATGTSSICGLPLAIMGTICMILAGWSPVLLAGTVPPGTTGYVYWSAVILVAITSVLFAPVGTRLAVWLPGRVLRRVFAVMLILSSFKLLIDM